MDVVTSTSTLEHVARDDIEAILRELRRVLAPDGVCSFAIDYHDHYASGTDVHPLNFLSYDDRAWRRWNSEFQFQNRLRHPDYVAMFEEAGFDVVEVEELSDLGERDLPPLADAFAARYTDAELLVTDGWFVLRNPVRRGVPG